MAKLTREEAEMMPGGEAMTDQDRIAALEAEVARLKALLDVQKQATAGAQNIGAVTQGDLEAEHAANVLFVAQVTTLTEQRDLAAAEAERMRAVLDSAMHLLDDVDQGPRSENSKEWRIPWSRFAVEVFTNIAKALAAPSTAAQVLSERDERVAGLAAGRERALVYRELREGALDGQLAEHDERVRREALKAAAKAADAETEPAGPMPHCPPEWSVEDVVRAAVRATRQAIAGRIRAIAEVKP